MGHDIKQKPRLVRKAGFLFLQRGCHALYSAAGSFRETTLS
jgi:hypothetical protein